MTDQLKPCCCGSTNLKPLSPYGVQSIQCRDCHVSLRAEDWNRVMHSHIPEGYQLVPIEPTEEMKKAGVVYMQEHGPWITKTSRGIYGAMLDVIGGKND